MKYLKLFENFEQPEGTGKESSLERKVDGKVIKKMTNYGILYAKVSFPKHHQLHWLAHCGLFDILPKDLKNEIISLSDRINQKWKDYIIVPMDRRIEPGIITKPEVIKEVAQDIFDGMNIMMKKLTGETDCIRLVYGVGELDEDWIENHVESTHEVGSFPIMIKIGRSVDRGSEPGIFMVN